MKRLFFTILLSLFFGGGAYADDENLKKIKESIFLNSVVPSVIGGRVSILSKNIKIYECTDNKNKKTLISLNRQSKEILKNYFQSVLEFHNLPNGALTYNIIQEEDPNSMYPAFISKAISKVYWNDDINSWWWYESRITSTTPKNYYILYNEISENYELTKDNVKLETMYIKLPLINNKINQNLKKSLEIPFERYMNSFDYKENKIGNNIYKEIDNYMLNFVNEEILLKDLVNTEFDFISKNSEKFSKNSTCVKKDYFTSGN